jgi:hypothetical protein
VRRLGREGHSWRRSHQRIVGCLVDDKRRLISLGSGLARGLHSDARHSPTATLNA